jgi:hypothetical protein
MSERHNIFLLTKRLERLEEDHVKLLQEINKLLARVEDLEKNQPLTLSTLASGKA